MLSTVAMCCHGDSGSPRQPQQQVMEFADEEEELLRDHEQSLRQLEVSLALSSTFGAKGQLRSRSRSNTIVSKAKFIMPCDADV